MLCMSRVGLEGDGTDLLEVPFLWRSEVPLVERQDGGQGEQLGLVQLPDLQTSVGAEVQEDVQTVVQWVRLLFLTACSGGFFLQFLIS